MVVVLATPPFWLAKTKTSACLTGTSGSACCSRTVSSLLGAIRSRGIILAGSSGAAGAAGFTST